MNPVSLGARLNLVLTAGWKEHGAALPWVILRRGVQYGFRRSFDKKGLRMKKKDMLQSFIIKEPLEIDYDNDSIEQIVQQIEYAIEQHPSFLKVIPVEDLKAAEDLNKLRRWDY